MLIDNIKKELMDAKKVKDTMKSNLLSALYSEIYTLSKSGKELTDEDSIKVIRKFIKNADETIVLDIPEDKKTQYKTEKSILETYLPKQLPAEEIEKIVSGMLSEGKNIKDIMGFFKEKYSGQYDGRTVNEAIKKLQT